MCDGPTHGRTDPRMDRPTDGRTKAPIELLFATKKKRKRENKEKKKECKNKNIKQQGLAWLYAPEGGDECTNKHTNV